MKKNNTSLEKNNLRYDDIEQNNKINEYNNIYNNNSINININKSKNSNTFNKSNNTNINNINNISSKEQASKEVTNNILKNNKNNPNNPNINSAPINNDINNLLMEFDYNSYINTLKNKLFNARAERRKKEEEAIMVQHRLTLLKNKEQTKIQNFKKMKIYINKILNNRNKVQENIKIKLNERNNFKKRLWNNLGKTFNYSSDKKKLNKTNTNYSKKPKIKNNIFTLSQNNFYKSKLDKLDFEQKSEKIDINKDINLENFNMDDDNINIIKSNDNISKDNIKLFKQNLIEKIKKDEEEKKKIEEEIAKIEEEEKELLNKFNKNNKSSENK